MQLLLLENECWQVGILPNTGSSTAFGRVRHGDSWLDVMRPTAESDYNNPSLCSSFIMLPWANRLRAAHFRYNGADYQLQPNSGDGTASHGVVRKLPWRVESADKTRIVTMFDSAMHKGIDFPFKFSARAEFRLEGCDFVMDLSLKNEDTQAFPAGFGHHPYFVRDSENRVQVEIPCAAYFVLVEAMATAPPVPVTPAFDFRVLRPLERTLYNDLWTARRGDIAARIVYPELALTLLSDPIFKHVLLYTPEGKSFFAVEPQSNANDGFNLYEHGIEGSGVFVLQPAESQSGTMILRLERE